MITPLPCSHRRDKKDVFDGGAYSREIGSLQVALKALLGESSVVDSASNDERWTGIHDRYSHRAACRRSCFEERAEADISCGAAQILAVLE